MFESTEEFVAEKTEVIRNNAGDKTKDLNDEAVLGARIKVVGVGGGGCNAINAMIRSGLSGVEFIAANTDRQALSRNLAPIKIQLGMALTKGLGAGANPSIGKNSAEESFDEIRNLLAGADMVFVTAGMGGGTGTGACPVIAQIARELGALTVAVVTKPFIFEAPKRMKVAEQGLQTLKENVDTIITIPNQRLLAVSGSKTTVLDAFAKADEVLLNAVQGISDLINISGHINLDFADVRTVMTGRGLALMGTGVAVGENRAVTAAHMAIASPLLEDVSIRGATGIIINITGPENLTLQEISEAVSLVTEEADRDAEVIFGSVFNNDTHDAVKVTVVATGFPADRKLMPVGIVADKNRGETITPVAEAVPTQAAAQVQPTYQGSDAIYKNLAAENPWVMSQKDSVSQVVPELDEEIKLDEPVVADVESDGTIDHKMSLSLMQAKKIAQELGLRPSSTEDLEIPAFLRKGLSDSPNK